MFRCSKDISFSLIETVVVCSPVKITTFILNNSLQELEINLDHANKANADAQKAVKRYADQVRELQTALEEEQRKREELRQSYNAVERRVAVAQAEKEDLQARLIQVRKSAHVARQYLRLCWKSTDCFA